MKNEHSPQDQTQLSAQFGLFSLPFEIINKVSSYLSGPKLHIIQGEATPEQQAEVVAFETYHLIIKTDGTYVLGFCEKTPSNEFCYKEQLLDKKSAFFRIVDQDFDRITHLATSQDPAAIKYLEDAIKVMGGVIKSDLQDSVALSKTCRAGRLWMKSASANMLPTSPEFKKTPKGKLFHKFLQHVSSGEQEQAEAILKIMDNHEFLLSHYKMDVMSCSEEFMFHDATAFKLAVRHCDWHMYNMMLKYIPIDQREKYESDLQQQLQDFEENRLSSTLDNLGACGLRVLENDPTPEQIKDAEEGNAYHLILHREAGSAEGKIVSAELGFRIPDPNGPAGSYVYVRRPLPEGELKDFVLNAENAHYFQRKPLPWDADERYPHLVIRNKKILRLAKKEIVALGGATEVKDNRTLEEYIRLLKKACEEDALALQANAPDDELIERWCVIIGQLQRLCFSSPIFARYWMSPNINWSDISETNFKSAACPPRASFHNGNLLFPFDSFFGGDYALRRAGCGLSMSAEGLLVGSMDHFVNSFCQVASENYQDLNSSLRTALISPPSLCGLAP